MLPVAERLIRNPLLVHTKVPFISFIKSIPTAHRSPFYHFRAVAHSSDVAGRKAFCPPLMPAYIEVAAGAAPALLPMQRGATAKIPAYDGLLGASLVFAPASGTASLGSRSCNWLGLRICLSPPRPGAPHPPSTHVSKHLTPQS